MKNSALTLSAVGTLTAASALLASTTLGGADARPPHRATTTVSSAKQDVKVIPLPAAKHFVRHVTNRYLPLKPGSKWVYKGYGADAGEKIVVRVLKKTKVIEGIKATVVSDIVTLDGELIEETRDWYAQDRSGRVWYLGEATTAYDGGVSSPAGSWEAGKDGAKAGVVMFNPGKLNKTYWQEFYPGEAEDQGELLSRSARIVGPTGAYRNVRITKDTTPLERDIMELKFYAPGVGVVFELGTSPEAGRVELVKFKRG